MNSPLVCESNHEHNRHFHQTVLDHQSDNPNEHGYFVYDLDRLNEHLSVLQQQQVVKLWYAVKANPLSRLIQTIADHQINFDVASRGELDHVLAQQVDSARILNTGPAKSAEQLAEFLSKGVRTFVIESINQLVWLQTAAAQQELRPQVLLRVQLQWPEGEKNPLGGNALTPFGLSTQLWQQINVDDFPNLNINGLHIFQWGNMLSNEKMYSLWQQMVPPLQALADAIGMQLKVLDLGGGLGVDYLASGQTINWSLAIEHLSNIKQAALVDELWLELGRYAVAECGYYVTSVVDVKTNFDQPQLVLAAGINHLLRPAITDQPFPAQLLRSSDAPLVQFDVHGPLCTSMDKLGQFALPEDIKVGDKLMFSFAGAYGFTESMPFFLCHEVAAEYCFTDGHLQEIRAAKPASWYLA